jgi:hypothetical protein
VWRGRLRGVLFLEGGDSTRGGAVMFEEVEESFLSESFGVAKVESARGSESDIFFEFSEGSEGDDEVVDFVLIESSLSTSGGKCGADLGVELEGRGFEFDGYASDIALEGLICIFGCIVLGEGIVEESSFEGASFSGAVGILGKKERGR